jgi:predicted extracellular nuclease
VLINEVYGGGGNSGATYTHDFVELVNVSSAPVSLDGWTLQYAAAGGDKFSAQPSAAPSPPDAHSSSRRRRGKAGRRLPAPDAVGSLAPSGTTGKVALVSSSAAITGPNDAASSTTWPGRLRDTRGRLPFRDRERDQHLA